ncbi:MAG: hypothetical protein JWP97_5637 [Labilithrix sp.]|nr:hypothetical protein [Labilithrix sp.]
MSVAETWIYRDDRRSERAVLVRRTVLRAVEIALGAGPFEASRHAWVHAAVLCGELESALADRAHAAASIAAALTDALAAAASSNAAEPVVRALAAQLAGVALPEQLAISTPEGFAFYALHPEACARTCASIEAPRGALVIGVRSIGTTLAAFAAEALRARGVRAERITVRPGGDPFDRALAVSEAERCALTVAAEQRAHVVVVDEGPGLSGSTLLAVVEAALAHGVAREHLTVVCSRAFSPAALRAAEAERRWRGIRTLVMAAELRPAPPGDELSGGAWRARHLADEADWPAVWPEVERRKTLVAREGGSVLYKYEGMGSGAQQALERGQALADAGLAFAPLAEGDGWVSYPWTGIPLKRTELAEPVLDMLARYCAARATLFPATRAADLGPMVAKNLRAVLGRDVALGSLEVERPVIVDGRLQPHEFVRETRGRVWKTDAVAHGDDHFFPGPTDVAWDLAGAIVEWELDEPARGELLRRYHQRTGDDAGPRIDRWTLAYAAFRGALTMHAHATTAMTSEKARLAADVSLYARAADAAALRAVHA